MVKLAVNPSPAAQAIEKASESTTVVDGRGRTITLKKPGVLAQYRLIEILGDSASNEVYVRMVLPLIYVSEIEGDMVPPCTRKSEIEALIQRLDEEGIAAVADGVNKHFGQRDPEREKAALKN